MIYLFGWMKIQIPPNISGSIMITTNSTQESDQNEDDEQSGDGDFSLLLGGSSLLVSAS